MSLKKCHLNTVLENKSELSRKRNREVGERRSGPGETPAKTWKKEERGGLEEMRESLRACCAGGRRKPSRFSLEGSGDLEAMLGIWCSLIYKCINGFQSFLFTPAGQSTCPF